MKWNAILIILFCPISRAEKEQSNPLRKVYELLSALEARLVAESEAATKSYKAFFEWCDERSKSNNYEIKSAASKKMKLEAKIAEFTSDISVGTVKVEDLSSAISTAESRSKEAKAIRNREASDFDAGEKELMATIDTLERASVILEKELAKGAGVALLQIDANNMESLLQSLSAVVDAASFSSDDHSKLMALLQSQEDDDSTLVGAPAAAKYSRKGGSIMEVLEDLKEKAVTELDELRKAEKKSKHSYDMVMQSLADQIKADNKDLREEKAGVLSASEGKAVAEADLEVTFKALQIPQADLAKVQKYCMRTATDHEANRLASAEELKALREARKILKESTSAGEKQTYSFLQVDASSKALSRMELTAVEVVKLVEKLAFDHHSAALSQLASRISAVVRYGSAAGDDPFAKVKGLIEQMLTKLQKEHESEASEKAYCDEQLFKTAAKKDELEDDIDKLSAKIAQAASRSAELTEEIANLKTEQAISAKTSSEMDKTRNERHAVYLKAQDELTRALDGVRKALGVLRDYFGNGAAAASLLQDDEKFGAFMRQPAPPKKFQKASGAGGSLIRMLELIESDMATLLAKLETSEADESSLYEEVTQVSKVSKTEKEKDTKYREIEDASLAKGISETSAEKELLLREQAAVLQYFGKIKERCIAKPELYKVRKAHRDAEIKGLREALSILESQEAFIQQRHHRGRRFFRRMG